MKAKNVTMTKDGVVADIKSAPTEYELTPEERAAMAAAREAADKLKLRIYVQNLELEAVQEQTKRQLQQLQGLLQQTIVMLHDADVRRQGAEQMLADIRLPGGRLSGDGTKLVA